MDPSTIEPPVTADAEHNLRLASETASGALVFLVQRLAERGIDPTITTKGLLDISEHMYKVSGMAKKQEAKEDSGRFVFNIHFANGKDVRIEKEVVGDTLEATPAVLVEEATNLLIPNESPFPDCPEFS